MLNAVPLELFILAMTWGSSNWALKPGNASDVAKPQVARPFPWLLLTIQKPSISNKVLTGQWTRLMDFEEWDLYNPFP